MKFNVAIIADNRIKNSILVDAEEMLDFEAVSGLSKSDIWEYNETFSLIVAQHDGALEYLLSTTLGRIEGITLFYEKICKFVYCIEYAKKRGGNIIFTNLDYKAAKALVKFMRESGNDVLYNRVRLFLAEAGAFVKFVCNLLRSALLTLFFMMSSKAMLKMPSGAAYDHAFITFYDYRSMRNGKHYEQYFDPFLRRSLDEGKKVMVLNHLLHSNKPSAFLKYINEIARTKCGYDTTVNYRFVRFPDIIAAIFTGLMKRPVISSRVEFKGYDITYLTRLGLREDLYNLAWFNGYLEYFSAMNLFKRYRIAKIFYPYENHAWEKALICARDRFSPGTKLIAFQHTSFSFKLLQHFPGREERALRIFPDKLLAAGRILRDVLVEKGAYPDGLTEEGCAMRHPYLFGKAFTKTPREKTRKIAYAFSFDMKNYERILSRLENIFSGTDYKLFLKYHPVNLGFIDKDRPMPPNFIDARDVSWEDLFEDIDILLYDDNSLAIEALKHNIKVGYFALAEKIYDTDRLFHYDMDKIIVDSVVGFKDFLRRFYDSEEHPVDDGRLILYNKEYLSKYFSVIDDEHLARFS